MSQRLILPINEMRLTAGYKSAQYRKEFGYTHYGVDATDRYKRNYTVYASGKGTVSQCGWNKSCGNVIVIVYRDCECPDGMVRHIAMRYYHLDEIRVKVGQKVSKDTVIGRYGNTGFSTGAHLHFECDSDIKYPNYTPQISANSSNPVLRHGIASTVLNPVQVLWVKTNEPDYQTVISAGYSTVSVSDLNYRKTTKC